MGLSVERLRAGYGERDVLRGLDLQLNAGEVLGVIGPNGAGKSTLVRVLTRRLALRAGRVSLDGRDLRSYGRLELARSLAVVPQAAALPAGFTVRELVAMGRTPHQGLFRPASREDLDAVVRAMRQTDTEQLGEATAAELSGGERQRVVLARALAQRPRYLLLDEPTTHLDLRYQIEVLSFTRRLARDGLGALAVLHDLNLAAVACDRLVVLQAGRVVAQGTPADVLTASLVARVYGADVEVHTTDAHPLVVPRFGRE